jgi:hypothetical protein
VRPKRRLRYRECVYPSIGGDSSSPPIEGSCIFSSRSESKSPKSTLTKTILHLLKSLGVKITEVDLDEDESDEDENDEEQEGVDDQAEEAVEEDEDNEL